MGDRRRLSGVLFDLDGTLYHAPEYTRAFRHEVIAFAAKRLKKPASAIRRLLTQAESAGRSLTQTLADAGLPKEQWHSALAQKTTLYRLIPRDPAVPRIFWALRAQGLRVGIVTNAARAVATAILRRLEVPPRSYHILVTGSETVPKPSLQPFAIAAKGLRLPPEEIAYVGDRIAQEIRPAIRAGMHGILIDRETPRNRQTPGYTTIHCLSELPGLLPRLGTLPPLPVVWISGRPAAGKTTVARALSGLLRDLGFRVSLLDSDDLRGHLLDAPTYGDQEKNIVYRALFATARLTSEAGAVVIIAATGFKQELRSEARALFHRYLEVYLHCPIQTAIQRDPKALYAQALAGHISTLPGISFPYDEPTDPDLTIDTTVTSPDASARKILNALLAL
jgi:adenylylsulfate kinase